MGPWCLPSFPLECVTHGCAWVVLWCGLKLSTRSVALEPPGGAGQGQSPATCALSGATQHELQSNLQMAAIVLGLEVPSRG